MIVIDSSALIAVLFAEPEKQTFLDIITGGERCVISAVNAHVTAMVLRSRNGAAAVAGLWQLLSDNDIDIVPFDESQTHAAVAAFDRYGKGIDSKAQLNLADCAAYALAKTMNSPLLFKGNDFAETDTKRCV